MAFLILLPPTKGSGYVPMVPMIFGAITFVSTLVGGVFTFRYTVQEREGVI